MRAGMRRVRNLVRTRTWSPKRVLFGARETDDRQPECLNGRDRPTRTRQRQTRGRAICTRHGPNGRSDAKHHAVAIHEGDVDCKLHEKRVDAAAGREDQGMAVGEARAAEKTAIASGRVERRFDGAGDDAAWRALRRPTRIRIGENRARKRQHTNFDQARASGFFGALVIRCARRFERQTDRPHAGAEWAWRPELPVVHGALVRRQEVHEPLVVAVVHAEQLQQRPVVAARRREAEADELTQIVPRDVALEQQRMDVSPERVVAVDERAVELVGQSPTPLAARRQAVGRGEPDGSGRSRVSTSGDSDIQAACSMTFCSSRTLPGQR